MILFYEPVASAIDVSTQKHFDRHFIAHHAKALLKIEFAVFHKLNTGEIFMYYFTSILAMKTYADCGVIREGSISSHVVCVWSQEIWWLKSRIT
jgi:hypothetical protein